MNSNFPIFYIFQLMLSVGHCPKAIIISGFHRMCKVYTCTFAYTPSSYILTLTQWPESKIISPYH